ncbi:ABC transporter permease [Streptomyces radicis]|uniref:ABC transporter permease n=1 Tax=Streptomyces radicis TaxID=1750517 RepID=A0A3A9WIN9_9ACTN|nr:ABC transporter permease [Streptomyces radicis]RKN12888.1 ABC transporter permease [Streptomyces radicis]RKN27347.1 ABC transporter permease [Streptomyces radicis]
MSETTTVVGRTRGMATPHGLTSVLSNRALQIIAVEILVIAIFQALSPGGAFLSEANVRGMALTASQVLLLAVGQAVLMSAGHIDISQGAAVILTSVLAGNVMISTQESLPMPAVLLLGALISVGAGAVIGAVNGVLVGVVGVNALVATLGMLSIGTGAAQVITEGVNLTGMPSELQTSFGAVTMGPLPMPMIVSLIAIAVIWAFYRFSSWGTHTLAMGSNPLAARRVGISTLRHTIAIFVLSSALAGLAGYIDLARYSTTNISGHLNDSMAAIAAALIGGTALTGGRISFLGAIVGAFLAIILQSGLVIINLSPFYQTIAIGTMLLIAVSLDPGARRSAKGGG